MTATPRLRRSRTSGVLGRVVVVSFLATAMVLGLGLDTARSDARQTQRGFALIWDPRYDGPQFVQSLREMVEVGATWVQFTPSWGQEASNASAIARTPQTVSDDNLERAIALAHSYGLKVFLTPHLYLPGMESRHHPPRRSRGLVASHTASVISTGGDAQRLGVEQFAVGSELSSITDDRPARLQVIGKYGLCMTAPHSIRQTRANTRASRSGMRSTMIGIDAYFRSARVHHRRGRVATVMGAHPGRDGRGSARYGRKILFTEAGYTSQAGTTTRPNNWRLSTPSTSRTGGGL